MKCPVCFQEMKYKDDGYWDYPFSTGDEPDYEVYHKKDVYSCKACRVKKINEDWEIPKKYERPTEKQIRTILFINNHLGTDFEPLLKRQCWKIINENLKEAVSYKEAKEEEMGEYHREMYGEWDYY